MMRWLPFPLLALGLGLMWLLLNQSLSAGHLLLAAVLAIGGVWALTPLEPPRGRLRRPGAVLRLAAVVLHDIVRSNIAVATVIIQPRAATRIAGFVHIPLELRAPHGLTLLAIIITSTPGTLWVNFDSAKGVLTIHVLDLIEEDIWIRTIKHRYERLLREIFE